MKTVNGHTAAWLAAGIALLAPAAMAPAVRAAEVRLRARCVVTRPLVTLGDVAEVFAADPQEARRLETVELFPAPPAGPPRFVRQREIEDLLALRGMNLAGHRFSGASQVEITQAGGDDRCADTGPTSSVARRAERLVREAVVRYLQENVDNGQPWNVQVQLDDAYAEAISVAADRIAVTGGAPPWTGPQRFEITVPTSRGPQSAAVEAEVSLPPAVVVAVRSVGRGAVVQATDVELQRGAVVEEPGDVFHSIDEVVGSETTRAIPAGKIVQRGFVRPPLLVRRGQVVTVYAYASGIRVKTTARARDDGSLGDLIAVESLLDRKSYFARVSGVQEVEVYARAARAGQDAAPSGPTRTY